MTSNKKCLEEGGTYYRSILIVILPEQIYFNKALERYTKSKIGPSQGTMLHTIISLQLIGSYRKGTLQQMMSTAMYIYSSLKHKHGVAGTAICYPAAINLLDVSNSTSLSDLGI